MQHLPLTHTHTQSDTHIPLEQKGKILIISFGIFARYKTLSTRCCRRRRHRHCWRHDALGVYLRSASECFFSHTHTEIFFGFARDFLSYFLFGFFKSDAKLLRWGINQSNAGTTRNAHKEQHQQQQQHCQQQQQLRGKRAWQLNERVVEE